MEIYSKRRYDIPTGGECVITPIAADHVHFDANQHCINGGPGDKCWIVYRGIEYGFSTNFTLVDGEWNHNPLHVHATRVSNSQDASITARKWMIEAARKLVLEYVETFPSALIRAERDRLERVVVSTTADVKDAERKLLLCKQELADALRAQENYNRGVVLTERVISSGDLKAGMIVVDGAWTVLSVRKTDDGYTYWQGRTEHENETITHNHCTLSVAGIKVR